MFVVVVVSRTVCRRTETFGAHGSPIMKISSEDDPTPHSANKSRWPLIVMVVCVLIFQSRFASVDMLAVFDNAMRGERAGIDSMVETLNRSEEHTSELQSPDHIVCRLLLATKNH